MKKIDRVILSETKCSRRISTYLFISVLVAFLAACSGEGGNTTNPSNDEFATLSGAEGQGSSSSRHCEECNDDAISGSDNAESNGSSDSSGAGKVNSSSSVSDVPKSYAEAKVMLSGTYDCSKYSCFTTEYLNQEFLEAGKYGEILDERDGQVYKTVQIDDQVWMAQNLNLETENSLCGGGFITREEGNCSVYGRQYTLAAAMGKTEDECGYDGHNCDLDTGYVRGICPSGWHLPDTTEWNVLFAAVGGNSTAGQNLKAQTRWQGFSSFTYEDAYGFSALPAGERNTSGTFGIVDAYAFFRSTTEPSIRLAYNDLEVSLWGHEVYGHSVRCVKD